MKLSFIDIRKAKIGTLLGVGIVAIIGLMVSATIYSNYLSNKAQNIIEKSSSRIFDVLTIQRDTGELYSMLSDLDVVRSQSEIETAKEKIDSLQKRAEETIRDSSDRNILSEDEALHATQILEKTADVAARILSVKHQTARQGDTFNEWDQNFYTDEDKELDMQFNNLRNIRFEMLGVFHEVTIRSDEEFRGAMELVGIAQIVTWVVIGISLVLASLLAFFLVRSVKKIFDLKNEFVNIIAHDLRNPVTAIIGYLELVTSDKNKKIAELHEDFQALTVSAQKLRSQISNLLEVGRTEAGRVKLNLESVQPSEIIKESILRAKALAEISGINVAYDKSVKAGVYVSADRGKFSDVLDNLISNAIKYNKKKGTVTISTQDSGDLFSISVTDTGEGIPENQKHKIFKRYSRLDTDKEKKVRGTGLGLYTVKLAMDKMKGTVAFKTKENEGTTFTISFKKVNKNYKSEKLHDKS